MTPQADLCARKQAFVAALAAGMTQTEAAQALGVKARTCRRYYADPLVRAAVKGAQDEVLSDVVRRMNSKSHDALDVLSTVMKDATMPGGVRIRAAEIWLQAAFKARELLDLAERVTALEERLKG